MAKAELKVRASVDQEALEEVRALTRELHEAVKDGRALIREINKAVGTVSYMLDTTFDAEVKHVVQQGLAAYQEQLARHIEEATAAVHRRFDTIADLLIQGKRGRPRKDLDLEQHAILQAAVAVLSER